MIDVQLRLIFILENCVLFYWLLEMFDGICFVLILDSLILSLTYHLFLNLIE